MTDTFLDARHNSLADDVAEENPALAAHIKSEFESLRTALTEVRAEVERLSRRIFTKDTLPAKEVAEFFLEYEKRSYNSETFSVSRLTSVIQRARQDGAAGQIERAEAAEARATAAEAERDGAHNAAIEAALNCFGLERHQIQEAIRALRKEPKG